MSNLQSQYLPIAFQLSNGSCKIRYNTNFKSCHDIYNLLIDRRNCISEFSKIKKAIPEKFIKVLKGETTIVPERSVTFDINDKLQLLNESNTTISPDKLELQIFWFLEWNQCHYYTIE
jgi:hypothetical protein